MATIAENLQAVRTRVAAAPGVTLLAVSKGHGIARIREAVAAGQHAFGENYVQDALEKIDALPQLEWHLIGPLQSNKTRPAAERFDWVQTVDREKIARRLSDQRPAHRPPLNLLIQGNISGERTKGGVAPHGVRELARKVSALPRLRLRGLMAIPAPGAHADLQKMKKLYDELRPEFGMDTLSMGMSDDLEAAIAAGSTMVRVGTAIFGQRAQARAA